ncbi:MAG: hypothetical protein QOG64_3323, partial [Acidimicrobiaceae bacterium]|nr:hypothetical protein [Acidimicrobiaceae bacterium]
MRPALRTLARARTRWPGPFRPSVTVLGYHRVDVEGADLAVRPDTFGRQMAVLRQLATKGLPVLSLDDAIGDLARGSAPRRAVILTFDDAWADNHENALPHLVAHQLPAVLYAPSRLLGTPGYMSREQLREMAAAGVTIGAHTRTHPDLRRCDDDQLTSEIRGSKDDLEELLGTPVRTFAYPTGLFNARVEAAVVAAGFDSAVTTKRGWLDTETPPFRI